MPLQGHSDQTKLFIKQMDSECMNIKMNLWNTDALREVQEAETNKNKKISKSFNHQN